MSNFNIQYVYWLVVNGTKKLGAWGVLGLLLAISSLLFYNTKIQEIKQLVTVAQAAKVTANAQLNAIEIIKEEARLENSAQKITTFYERFPRATILPETLSQINILANKQLLALNSGDYKLNKIREAYTPNERVLTKYEIVLPVKGQYAQIRTFISEVLKQQPAIALMDMQLHRENTLSPSVDARLVFVLFVKGDSW